MTFYDNFMLPQNIFGYIRAKNYVKINVFKKGIQKCMFPKKIGDPRFLTDNLFL
jgi:hypothetical protein